DCKLRGRVETHRPQRRDTAHRGHVDDVGFAAARDHAGQEGHQRINHAADVDAHDPVPVAICCVFHRAVDAHTGIVDEHLNGSVCAFDLGLGGGQAGAVRHVHLDG